MNIARIKTISDNNIDRIIKENLYRGFLHQGRRAVEVQCMNKDVNIVFDFVQEVATINREKVIPIESLAPKNMMRKIVNATC